MWSQKQTFPDTRHVINEVHVNADTYDDIPRKGSDTRPAAPKHAKNRKKSFTFNRYEYMKTEKNDFYNLHEG